VEKFIPENITNAKEVIYDYSTLDMDIVMIDGSQYQYKDVPERVFSELKKSPSVGSFLHRYVKGNYRYWVIICKS